MPKPHTFPFIIDETHHISISDLRKWNYLKPNSNKSGIITWSRNGQTTGKISIEVIINQKTNILILDYKCNDKKYNYKVSLTTLPSNLGKGSVWYFLCPFTLKRCRKLHLIDERFIHRSALSSGVYSKQLHTKKWRELEKVYGNYFDNDEHYKELYSKHFKKFYNGKPTKRYLKLMEKINDGERFSSSDIERLLMM